ncbi:MAG: methyltransferase domain-containing protein [Pyrodictiaceae archaeon]
MILDSFFSFALSITGNLEVPWVPTRRELIAHILRIAGVKKGLVFYDLGCGDGRVVIEAAKRGAKGVCVEIRSDLIREAIRKSIEAGVRDKIEFINADFMLVDLNPADVIYMYLLTRVNAKLRPKLEKELRPGTRVVTLDFEIPGWKPIYVEKHFTNGMERKIYLYIKGISDVR